MADRHAAVVLGGGLAGTSLALRLAAAGREVLLLERSRGPHNKVCGEFLSGEALHYLREHGVQPEALGAVPIRQVRLASQSRFSSADLPFPAQSLSRLCLDEYLLQAAVAAGVEIRRGTHVGSLQPENGGWAIDLREGKRVHARDVFLATGKHDLRTQPRPTGTHTGLVGFKMYYRLPPAQANALQGAVELALFPGGYAGLQPVEGGRANLCLLVDAATLRRCGGNWTHLQGHILQHSAHLRTHLQDAEPLLDAPLTVASIPYGHVQQGTEPGLWRLGDQAAVIPSFSGDGMSIALHSAALAAQTYLWGDSSPAFQRKLAGQMGRRLWLATALSRTLVQRPWMAQLAHLFPALLPRVGSMTRIPDRDLLHADATACVDSLR